MNDPLGHEPQGLVPITRHYMKDMVFGANDGIITTFAVVSGVAGASLGARIVLILGFANLLADGFSMGASNYLAIRSDEAVRQAAGDGVLEPYPIRHGMATFLAFIIAGAVPLVSYMLALGPSAFPVAVFLTLATLFVVGAARTLVTNVVWWRGGMEMLIVGTLAAAAAYGVGAAVDRLTS